MESLVELRRRFGLSQAELARLAGTSQPAIAAYESGSKSPHLRTIERIAESLGQRVVIDFEPALTREEARSLALHRAIAFKLGQDPAAVIEKARVNLDRLTAMHPHAGELLDGWRDILEGSIDEIVDVLVDTSPESRELRHVTPFAGVLTARERAEVYRQFSEWWSSRR
jgi:transcriptional regulator with XRE-family HTH domain